MTRELTQRRLGALFGIAALAATLAACSALLGIEALPGPTPGNAEGGAGSGGDGAGPGDEGGSVPGGEAGACSGPSMVQCGAVCRDTANDRKNCGGCGHDCQGGGCSFSRCEMFPLLHPTAPVGLALDGNNNIYVSGAGYPTYRCSVDPSICNDAPVKVAQNGGGSDFTQSIAVVSGSLFWVTDENVGSVIYCPVPGGCGPTTDAKILAKNLGNPKSIAVDAVNAYFTNSIPNGAILTCNLLGCNGSPTALTPGAQNNPTGIYVANGNVFWTNAGMTGTDGAVMMCPAAGCPAPTVLVSAQNLPSVIVADDTSVYFTEETSKQVVTCKYASCASTTKPLVQLPDGGAPPPADTRIQAIAVHKGTVYWSAGVSIYACPVAGCTAPALVALDDMIVEGIAVDDTAIYWASYFKGVVNKRVLP